MQKGAGGLGPNRRAGERGFNVKARVDFTDERKKLYLEELARTGRKYWSAAHAGVAGITVLKHSRLDPEFAEAEEEALRIYGDRVDQEIGRRGIEGVQEAVYHEGVIVGWKTRYSDTLLMAHAKAHNPLYKERVEVDQKVTGEVSVGLGLEQLNAAQRDLLRQMLLAGSEESEDDAGPSEA